MAKKPGEEDFEDLGEEIIDLDEELAALEDRLDDPEEEVFPGQEVAELVAEIHELHRPAAPSPQRDDDRPPVSEHGERHAVLAEVLRDQAVKAETRGHLWEDAPPPGTYGLRHIALLVVTIAAAYIWTWPPTALRIEDVPSPPVAEEEAALRYRIYFYAQAVEQFFIENGRIPEQLDQAGPVSPGIDYIPLTGRHYRILGRTDRVSATLSSTEPAAEFLRESALLLDLGIQP